MAVSIGIDPPFCPKCGGTMYLVKTYDAGEDPYYPHYRLVFACGSENWRNDNDKA